MITHRVGNLLKQNDLNGWIHQANCFNTMKSGVAKEVRETYPEVYEADSLTKKGDIYKLGTFSFAQTKSGQIGYNLYSQFNFGRDGKCYTNYDAIYEGLLKIKQHALSVFTQDSIKIGIPCKMGCVRGGGSWSKVLNIIKEVFENSKIEIVICEFKEYSQQSDDDLKKLRSAYKKADMLGLTEENTNEN